MAFTSIFTIIFSFTEKTNRWCFLFVIKAYVYLVKTRVQELDFAGKAFQTPLISKNTVKIFCIICKLSNLYNSFYLMKKCYKKRLQQ